jgi:16S rRNA (guanine(527)-N(7))-methyltransferase RsmG
MEDFKSMLASEFSPYGTLSGDQLALLDQHYRMLLLWNSKINLTRISSLTDIVRFHYCESLYLGHFLPNRPLRIVDIGSGAGFPGIPVAIYRADCEVDLVESHQRKAVFLRETTRNLPNVRVLAKRADDLIGTYDWIISRGVRAQDVMKLDLASNLALLGTEGERLPWGESRALFHVER